MNDYFDETKIIFLNDMIFMEKNKLVICKVKQIGCICDDN